MPDVAAKTLEAHNRDGHKSPAFQARLDKFHAFQWFVTIPHEKQSSRYAFSVGLEEKVSSSPRPEKSNARSFDVDSDRLEKLFSEMHKTVRTTSGRVRRPYNKCPPRSLKEVEVRLAKLLQKGNQGSVDAGSQRNVGSGNERQTGPRTGIPDSDDQIRSQSARTESITSQPTEENIRSLTEGDIRTLDLGLSRQIRRLVINAKRCFVFFLPLEYSSGMVSKYWGAVYSMIDVSREPMMQVIFNKTLIVVSQDHDRFTNYHVEHHEKGARLGGLLGLMTQITDEMSHGEGPFHWTLALPTTFADAWLQLVACFIFMSGEDYSRAESNLRYCFALLYKGRKDLMRSLASSPFYVKETVLPLGVAALLFKNLHKDITLGSPGVGDVLSTYDEYYNILVGSLDVSWTALATERF